MFDELLRKPKTSFLTILFHLRRLYNESKNLHATHDATLLKSADGEDQRQIEFSQAILTRLQAGAFESLCEHLRARSESVQNMELMTISGFCRNCLAKVSLNIVDFLSSIHTSDSSTSYIFYFCSGLLLKHVGFRTK